tara:strand:+ start:293 stop:727 length:435 start_codon:yes stop_codon:yes gene_type:complete
MPTYSGRCDEHGEFEDLMKIKDYIRAGGLTCPICEKRATTIINAVPTIGAMPSKPLRVDQIGQTFHSEAEKRAYFKRHPDRVFVDPNDSSFTKHRDLAAEKAELAAKKLGYNDHEDRKTTEKKRQRKLRQIKHGDRKIQVVTNG